MNTIQKQKISEKAKKNYFKLQNFVKTFKIALIIFTVIIPLGIIVCLFIRGKEHLLVDISTWKDMGIVVVLGFLSALLFAYLSWLKKIDVSKKRQKTKDKYYLNKEKIYMLECNIQDIDDFTSQEEILREIKELKIKNEQIENNLKVLDM